MFLDMFFFKMVKILENLHFVLTDKELIKTAVLLAADTFGTSLCVVSACLCYAESLTLSYC